MSKVTTGFRLKGSGRRVDLTTLPDEFLAAIGNMINNTFQRDPEAVIAFLGYAFGGLQIDDLRERLVVFPNEVATIPSRETVRRILIRGCRAVNDEYVKLMGTGSFIVSSITEDLIGSGSAAKIIPDADSEEESDDDKRKAKEEDPKEDEDHEA